MSLYKAVEILTNKREQSCCVERNYVRKIYDYYTLSEDLSSNKCEAEKIDISYIINWEKLHDSFIGNKRPDELVVCYLSGPEPNNDFNELTHLGILPQNIWAFESDNRTYRTALDNFEEGEYPQPRILRQNINTFFQQAPKKFDIVYIDACGSIPSTQHALKCVSTLCLYHRLNSPGVIITNFAMPDITTEEINDFYEVVAQYLFFKKWPDEDIEINECGIVSEQYDDFFNEVKENFNLYYGEYISAVLRDIPAVIIPSERIGQNPYFKQIINEAMINSQSDTDFIHLSKGISIARYFFVTNLLNEKRLLGKKSQCFFGEIGDFNALLIGLKINVLFKSKKIQLKEDIEKIKKFFELERNVYQFLDKTHSNLFFDIIVNQLSYPMHHNTSQNERYQYVAKSNSMFTDVNVYDECRYIYEWLPGLHQIMSSFQNKSWQYVFRFALDGLIKMRQNYNNEFFFQGSVISKDISGFSSKTLSERVEIK